MDKEKNKLYDLLFKLKRTDRIINEITEIKKYKENILKRNLIIIFKIMIL